MHNAFSHLQGKINLITEMTVVKGPASKFKRKHKVLMLSTRGINHRYRHLLNDLDALLAHSKKGISSPCVGDDSQMPNWIQRPISPC